MSSASGSAGGGVLQRMVEEATLDEQEVVAAGMEFGDRAMAGESDGSIALDGMEVGNHAYEGKAKGKGKMAVLSAFQEEVVEERPFRLFDLPTEIRLEIYRACLTRPYKILLSKPIEKPAPKPEETSGADGGDGNGAQPTEEDESSTRSVLWRQSSAVNGSAQSSPRRRAGNRGSARATLRASSSSAQSQSSATAGQQGAAGAAAASAGTMGVFHSRSGLTTRKYGVQNSLKDSKMDDPLLVNILRANKDVYREGRDVLYGENVFELDVFTAVNSLAALHQRSRRRIKHVELEIPTYTEILESFSETVRLSLRYCFGLRRLVIRTPFTLPGGDAATGAATSGNTTVYANGFDILRWLPQGCKVELQGNRNADIDAVVGRHMRLAGVQDKVSWHRAQLAPISQGPVNARISDELLLVGLLR